MAAMYCEDGEPLEWHRAQIFAINNLPKVTVNYVDYGTEGQVCLSNLRLVSHAVSITISKDQENPNFWAFDTFGSLTNNPVFNPGSLGKYPDGTEISKF